MPVDHDLVEIQQRPLPEGDPLHPAREYRWHCTCGASGRWWVQSPAIPRHAFRKHQERKAEQTRRKEGLER